jgi:hypothetical protein
LCCVVDLWFLRWNGNWVWWKGQRK